MKKMIVMLQGGKGMKTQYGWQDLEHIEPPATTIADVSNEMAITTTKSTKRTKTTNHK